MIFEALALLISSVVASVVIAVDDMQQQNNDGEPPPNQPPGRGPNQGRRGQGRAAQAPRFSQQEKRSLVVTIRSILPIGPNAWQQVANEHNQNWPTNRSEDSCRRQFAKLHKTKMPTGDPRCPPEVREAKQAKREIREKAEMGSGNSDVSGLTDLELDQDFGDQDPPAAAAAAHGDGAAAIPDPFLPVDDIQVQAAVGAAARHGSDNNHSENPPQGAANVARRSTHDNDSPPPGFSTHPMFPSGVIPMPRPVGNNGNVGNPKKKKSYGKKGAASSSDLDMNSILQLCQMQALQSITQSAADDKKSKEEKEERDRERRDARRMDERFMRMMMLMMAGFAAHEDDKKTGKRKRDEDYE